MAGQPLYDPQKVRTYDSYWNWSVQDALEMHLHVLAAIDRINRGEAAPRPDEVGSDGRGVHAHYEGCLP